MLVSGYTFQNKLPSSLHLPREYVAANIANGYRRTCRSIVQKKGAAVKGWPLARDLANDSPLYVIDASFVRNIAQLYLLNLRRCEKNCVAEKKQSRSRMLIGMDSSISLIDPDASQLKHRYFIQNCSSKKPKRVGRNHAEEKMRVGQSWDQNFQTT